MKSKSSINLLSVGLFAALVATAMPELSIAADGLSGQFKEVSKNQLSSVPDFIAAIAYVIGAILMLSGALSLKKHSENPATEPMAKGIGRLVTGGAVLSLPALARVMQETTELQGGDAKFNAFSSDLSF